MSNDRDLAVQNLKVAVLNQTVLRQVFANLNFEYMKNSIILIIFEL